MNLKFVLQSREKFKTKYNDECHSTNLIKVLIYSRKFRLRNKNLDTRLRFKLNIKPSCFGYKLHPVLEAENGCNNCKHYKSCEIKTKEIYNYNQLLKGKIMGSIENPGKYDVLSKLKKMKQSLY